MQALKSGVLALPLSGCATLDVVSNSTQSVHSSVTGLKVPTHRRAVSFIQYLLSVCLKAGTVLGAEDRVETRGAKSLPHGAFTLVF